MLYHTIFVCTVFLYEGCDWLKFFSYIRMFVQNPYPFFDTDLGGLLDILFQLETY